MILSSFKKKQIERFFWSKFVNILLLFGMLYFFFKKNQAMRKLFAFCLSLKRHQIILKPPNNVAGAQLKDRQFPVRGVQHY